MIASYYKITWANLINPLTSKKSQRDISNSTGQRPVYWRFDLHSKAPTER